MRKMGTIMDAVEEYQYGTYEDQENPNVTTSQDALNNIISGSNLNNVMRNYVKQKPYVREEKKIQRNDPCPCGSNKKYKNCCGR